MVIYILNFVCLYERLVDHENIYSNKRPPTGPRGTWEELDLTPLFAQNTSNSKARYFVFRRNKRRRKKSNIHKRYIPICREPFFKPKMYVEIYQRVFINRFLFSEIF